MVVNVANTGNAGNTVSTPQEMAVRYWEFSRQQARGRSDAHEELSARISHDDELCELLAASLPAGHKQQPDLLLAAVRQLDGPHAEWGPRGAAAYGRWREWTIRHWDEVRSVIMRRSARTDEPARCATLLPLLARMPQPLALLEVGTPAGLCLYPDRYRYQYVQEDGRAMDGPGAADSPVTFTCRASGFAPDGEGGAAALPGALPEVVWRGGIDPAPLDPFGEADDLRWLRALVWPGDEARAARLSAAVEAARTAPRPTVVRGDLLDELPALAAQVPSGATLVVFHSAALNHLPPARREEFARLVRSLLAERDGGGHWISQEHHSVLPWITAPEHRSPGAADTPLLTLALDERPVALTDPHGRSVHWLPSALS
ncbi:DUF2332 domain-containing protein [Streptomyces yunnanensis]|uniref:DUF2332 domain-containing protein n=1 Tax=Streptomyces yunnanensis TaxID=156453 RepID=A0ABY8A9Y7_9ACTN|nr:DUF2332 domain-containing protein [Streptomyces yunnanensis]WEB41810.1 DUF2332 domain-containing protein [Streptomyces yunnanensis]